MAYEIKGKQSVYSGHVFCVEKIAITLPDKRERKYDLVQIQNAVTILPLDEDGNVVFVKQYRIGSNSILLELPAGKIEDGEKPQTTAEREIREETGLAAGKILPMGKFFMSPGYSTEFMYTYLATNLYSAPLDPDADEFLNIEKIPLQRALQMIHEGKIEDGKTLATFMLAAPYLPDNK